MQKEKLWFKAKLFGWGWRPASWEGWVITLAWIVLNISYFERIDNVSHSSSDTIMETSPFFVLSTVILLLICYKKGERPYWNWGKRK